ncbi:MAG: serine protease [Bryobacteraceae bacterium]|nr:serine protease [Bryobacteraceae bacterium]
MKALARLLGASLLVLSLVTCTSIDPERVIENTVRIFRSSPERAAVIFSPLGLNAAVRHLRSLPEPKALAFGVVETVNQQASMWVAGWAFSERDLESAKNTAIKRCEEIALIGRGRAIRCSVYYENDTFVGSALAANVPPGAASPRPEPKTDAKVVTGSGTFVSDDGLVLTAEHVIRNAKRIEVQTRDGRRGVAQVKAASRSLDLAVLTTGVRSTAFFPVGLARPAPGTRVFTVGYPVPGLLGQEPKVADGVVSALSGLRDDAGFMQITVPVQPGNSGGPLITEDGVLVGVVTSVAAIRPFLERTGALPQNVNWAVHSSLAVTLLGKEGPKAAKLSREQAIEQGLGASVLVIAYLE